MAEYDLELARRGALVHERGGVVGVRESGRAGVLEEQRERRRPARLRAVVVPSAAQLVVVEGLAPALARHHAPVLVWRVHLQLVRARVEQVGAAPDHRAHALALVWGHRQGHVEPVDQAHAVRREVAVAVVEAELGQRRRSPPAGAVALELAAAVSGVAGEAVVVADAAGSGPDPAGPVLGRRREGAVGEGR